MTSTLDAVPGSEHELVHPTAFEPIGVVARYAPSPGAVDPDTSKGWIRRMLPVLLAHRVLFFWSLAVAAVALVVNVALPAVVGAGVDAVRDPNGNVAPHVTMFAVLAVVRGLTTYGYRNGLYRIAYAIEYDLRTLIYEHLSRMSFSYFDRVQTGQLVSRANSDIRSVQMLLAFAPFMSMMILTFVFAFGYMVTVSVPLTIVAIITLPGVYVFGVRLRNVMFPVSWIIQGRLAEISTIVEENITGVRVVKSFAAEKRQIALLARAAQAVRWISVRMQDQRARYGPLMENLPRLGMAFVLLYGGHLVIDGQVSLGKIVIFNSYVILLQAPFRMLGFFLMMSQRAAASAGRIFEILDEQPDVVDRPGAVDLVDPRGAIEFRNVSFRYGSDPDAPLILDGFDLTIEPGETIALVGRTGCGKSTVARLLERFYDTTSGTVAIDGIDVRDLTIGSLRYHLGFVSDEPFLFSVSIRDNIAYGRPDASDEEIERVARAASAHDFIMELPEGYDSVVGERGYTLSGGQRQRIAIARTLLLNPRMLVLDDATSAIDVRIEAEIHNALHDLLRDRTTILVAHRLSTIAQADRVVLMDAGKVVATGPHQQLMASVPLYAEILANITEDDAVAPDDEPEVVG